jgi:CheY-like chemotaxis protein
MSRIEETTHQSDDEPLIRAAHRYLLEGLGYGVVEAPDGERALELALKHRFFCSQKSARDLTLNNRSDSHSSSGTYAN